MMCVESRGTVSECPEPYVTIRGSAEPAAVFLSEDKLTVKSPNAPPSLPPSLPRHTANPLLLDLLFMGTLARRHNRTLLCLMFV